MFRRTLLFSYKYQQSDMLFDIIRISYRHSQICYFSNVPLKTIGYGTQPAQLVSKIFKSILQHNLKYSCAMINDKPPDLNEDFLDSEDEKEKEGKKIINLLLSRGYTNKDIKNKFSPYLKSIDCSYAKFVFLTDMDSDLLALMPLLSLPVTVLKSAAKQARSDKIVLKNFPNRIHYLSLNLEHKYSELIPSLAKHSALLTMPFKRLNHKMNILKNANISSKYIVTDLWIFNYNERLLANRVQSAVDAGIELKPWMLRCSQNYFEVMLERYSETQRILGGESVKSYLAKKLECNEDYIKFMMERNKLLKTVNILKLEQVSNFLFEKGYTPQEVRLFPRVFCSSVQTLNRRFEEYKRVKSTLPTISQLCIASKKFEISLKKN